jgi:hypothetical protein
MAAAAPITIFTLELTTVRDGDNYSSITTTTRLPGVFMTEEEAINAAHSYMRNDSGGHERFFNRFIQRLYDDSYSKVSIIEFTVGADSVAVSASVDPPDDMKAEFEEYAAECAEILKRHGGGVRD